jgi:peptidoglycan/xylan/chitin deacetylase (PgdA/CDA1 family)
VESDYSGRGLSFVEARQKVRALKEMPNAARLTFLSAVSDVDMRQLTYAELSELAANRISIANHSHTHPMFNYCTSTEINAEMEQSRSFFNVFQTGYFDVFAYPNGNFDKETEQALKKEGIRYAFLFDHKLNNLPVNPMRISRIRVNADHDLSEFKLRVSGLHRMLARVK